MSLMFSPPLDPYVFIGASSNKNILKHNIMGYIKEPKGVDFIIKSNPLTDKDRSDISKLITDYKKKSKLMKENKTIRPSRKKVAA